MRPCHTSTGTNYYDSPQDGAIHQGGDHARKQKDATHQDG
eukprot:CAMPEP_0179303720 /NCGR_PEP_ID=MMETSP0797-20121207/48723_1 /TAXON_ID=47934 /ORGANISM="Dinophysis acuminata, Strain DAEP01" /LENGTH=39 /DNA_ID= /DNA_START= /DNA_END= /DNA_ORIENTATION=